MAINRQRRNSTDTRQSKHTGQTLLLLSALYLLLVPVTAFATDMTPPGNALEIDGAEDYVEIADNDLLDLTTSYTIEAWIRPDSFNWLGGIVTKYHTSSSSGYFLRLSGDGNYRGLGFDGMETADDLLTSGEWAHVAAVNDNGSRTLYVNGVAKALTGTAHTVAVNGAPVCIGVDYLSDARHFDGQLDEVRIWSTARTESQIRATMNRVLILVGTETGLVAYYNFDHTSGTVLFDRAANGLDATLTNMAGNEWLPSTLPWRENNDDYQVGDMNDDGQVGLEEAIIALQVVAGLTPGVTLGTSKQLIDADGDRVPDAYDICPGGDDAIDSDGDGVPDGCDICPDGDDSIDSDGDGVPDDCDVCPEGDDNGTDADGDGVPDACDICQGHDDNGTDADGDGVPDVCDICPDGDDTVDSDSDGVPDDCDICPDVDNDSCNNRYIFVGQISAHGTLGGLSGADNFCNYKATNVGLQESEQSRYKAWLSTDSINAKDRFEYTEGMIYVNMYLEVVSSSFEGLKNGVLENPIKYFADKRVASGLVWTGTLGGGLMNEHNCNGWTSNDYDDVGLAGNPSELHVAWTAWEHLGCHDLANIYCIEDR